MPNLNPDLILQLKGDVRFRVMDDEAVIVCQDTGEILAVNRMGKQVLEAAEKQKSVKALMQSLESKYDVPEETLKKDILAFIDEMIEAGVLKQ